MKKAIVISAGCLGLGIIRSLGMAGIKSIVIYQNRSEVGRLSRYCVEKVKLNSYLDKNELYDLLMKNKDKWGGLLIIPGNDESLETISYFKPELEKHYIVYVPGYSLIKRLINKKEMLKIAKKANIPFPRTLFPKSISDLERYDIKFPCLLKPVERHLFYPIFNTKLFRIKDMQELKSKYQVCLDNSLEVSITELIPGEDTNLYSFECYVSKASEITEKFVKVKIRQTPPFFGVGRVSMSTENKDIEPLARAFFSAMRGFRGPAYIEFKYDERDGKYKFIEINARFIISVILMTKCGINMPHILYSEYVDNRLIRCGSYRKNIYWIQLFHDLVTPFYKEAKEEKMGFLDFIRPYLGKKVFAFESASDPMPMVADWYYNITSLVCTCSNRIFGRKADAK
jgi:predicted ATP-grasp superfamily ATP-dependent carboligase